MEHEQFIDCLSKGQDILRLAKEDDWEGVEEMEPEWGRMVQDCFSQKVSSQNIPEVRGVIKELLSVNEEVIALGQLKSQFLNEKVITFNKGKKAVKAYQ
jgi:hypothetical protein